jgi:subtilisin family serine protease
MNKQLVTVLMLLALSLWVTVSNSKTLSPSEAKSYEILDPQNAGRLLLVGFADNTIGSLKNTASPISYRQRGSYQSSTWSERVTSQLADDYHLEKLSEWPMTEVGVHCVVYRVPRDASVEDAMSKLSKDKRVEIVQNMHTYKTRASSSNDPYYKLQTNLQLMQIDLAHGRATGKDIEIGMIDTGVDMEHPDLAGQITKKTNFAEEISKSFSTDKHGTAVAGIMVARRDNSMGIVGIAPNAKLYAWKACWPDQPDAMAAVCNSYTLAMAINTAIKAGVKILNMSLTGPEDPLLSILLKKALAKGIVVVAADTGLDNPQENFPASLPDVISVQSLKQPNENSAGKRVSTVAAPGEKILTTLPHGTYDFISGSSIAAAEVSGVVALLLELKPELTIPEIHAILQKSKFTTNNGIDVGINANVAVNSVCEKNQCTPGLLSYAKNMANNIR